MIITRIWDYRLLPYLPDAQFKGQFRELVAIMHDWRDKGTTNHLLINRVMEYPKSEFVKYVHLYAYHYNKRYNKCVDLKEFAFFSGVEDANYPYEDWHNKEYLRVCMANLYEKHFFGIGKSRITDEEWARLCEGYKDITGEEYEI